MMFAISRRKNSQRSQKWETKFVWLGRGFFVSSTNERTSSTKKLFFLRFMETRIASNGLRLWCTKRASRSVKMVNEDLNGTLVGA